jgi:hypothetical protein
MIQKSSMLVLQIVFFSLIGLLEDFATHKLVSGLVCNIHVSTSHGETKLRLLFLGFLQCCLLG